MAENVFDHFFFDLLKKPKAPQQKPSPTALQQQTQPKPVSQETVAQKPQPRNVGSHEQMTANQKNPVETNGSFQNQNQKIMSQQISQELPNQMPSSSQQKMVPSNTKDSPIPNPEETTAVGATLLHQQQGRLSQQLLKRNSISKSIDKSRVSPVKAQPIVMDQNNRDQPIEVMDDAGQSSKTGKEIMDSAQRRQSVPSLKPAVIPLGPETGLESKQVSEQKQVFENKPVLKPVIWNRSINSKGQNQIIGRADAASIVSAPIYVSSNQRNRNEAVAGARTIARKTASAGAAIKTTTYKNVQNRRTENRTLSTNLKSETMTKTVAEPPFKRRNSKTNQRASASSTQKLPETLTTADTPMLSNTEQKNATPMENQNNFQNATKNVDGSSPEDDVILDDVKRKTRFLEWVTNGRSSDMRQSAMLLFGMDY